MGHIACCICSPRCPHHTTDIGEFCIKHLKDAECTASHPQKDAGLCYKQCPSNQPYQFGLICTRNNALQKALTIVVSSIAVGIGMVLTDGAISGAMGFLLDTLYPEIDLGAAIPFWEAPEITTTLLNPEAVYGLNFPF